MNLLDDPWIPVRNRDGTTRLITPDGLTGGPERNPVAAVDAGRPDLDSAAVQFLIGLLQTAFGPKNESEWRERWESPPSPEMLRAAFGAYREAFNLDGEGPLFMQDRSIVGTTKSTPIGAFFIDDPGENGEKNNTDHFIKAGRFQRLSLPYAALALFTLQTNAPSGGAGHRTSLRGGGPMTTLLVPDKEKASLWETCWLNVLPLNTLLRSDDKRKKPEIFPWLGPVRTSEKGQATTPETVSPLQAYWGMPRRIAIDFSGKEPGFCTLSGREGTCVTRYFTKPYGVNYEGAWKHPLSPYYFAEEGGTPNCYHPQPEGIGYRHWLGLVLGQGRASRPATVVEYFGEYRYQYVAARLWAFGYDMDNMKARGWHDALMPVYTFGDGVLKEEMADWVGVLIHAAGEIGGNLRSQIKEAWGGKEVKGDLTFATDSFWDETQNGFYTALARLYTLLEKEGLEADPGPVFRKWFGLVNDKSLEIFDRVVERGDVAFENPKRIYTARLKLFRFNRKKALKEALKLDEGKE